MSCRIGIISDIHFGILSRTNELVVPGEEVQDNTIGAAPLLEGASEIFKQHSIDYLFIAGDLTSVASPQEYYYCEKAVVDFATMCGITTDNIIFCTGNHDVDWQVVNLAQGCKSKDSKVKEIVAEKYQRIAAATGVHIISDMIKPQNGIVPFSGVVEKERFVVFVLNTGLFCSNEQKVSHGKLGERQLNWLKDSLERFKDDTRDKIVLMHHHPVNYPYPILVWDPSLIEEDSDFTKIIGENDVTIVIHGHRHHPRVKTALETNWKHAVVFLCAGSFSVNADHRLGGEIPNTLHILELTNSREKYILYNYQYASGIGWKPAQFNDSTMPLDYKMQVGKVVSDETACSLIKNYEHLKRPLNWEDLDDDLKYLPVEKINKLFRSVLKPNYSVIGKFPEEVVVLPDKREEIK